ncbi:ABC transporter substrate-binding protein, partial [Streptomyces sp. T-3]|nr:ABC transporter substrate-binding protein [Streptomyces sp. T-3]
GGGPSAAPPASGNGESTDRMPRDEQGRPAYAQDTLLPALAKAVHRPRTPLYGAFTQIFAEKLGRLYGSDAVGERRLATELDEALREALPGGR